jgi:Tol biopolymer transport system component
VPFEGGEVAYGSTPSANYHLIGSQPGGRALMFGANWPADINYPLLSKDLVTDRFARVFNINAQDGSWSPDGKAFAYAQVENLYVRAADGSTSLVASVKGVAYWLRWSPDGSKIRFSESSQGFHDRMWEVNSAGGQLHQILLSRGDTDHICCGSWTADGRGFVYLSVGANNSSIHVRSENESSWGRWTGSTIDIPAAPLDKWIAPVPSPDGKHVFVIGEQLHGKLVRINPATREPEPFVSGISAEGLSFSPDQADVAWTAYPEGTLWRSQSDGSNRVQLTQSPLIARFPRWSPDGRTIVFTGARPGSDWQLYTVPANGGKVKPVLFEAASQGVATWSPDGKSLVFGHLVNSGTEKNRHLDIQIVRLADGKTTLLAGSAGLWTARWSPDGQFISAVTEDGHTLKLYDVRERVWSDLAHGNINDVVWSPDSRSLFFDTGLGAQPAVYRVRLMDGKLETWATLPNFRRAGFFAPWLGMGPDGAPILLEDAGVQELYSVAVNLP